MSREERQRRANEAAALSQRAGAREALVRLSCGVPIESIVTNYEE